MKKFILGKKIGMTTIYDEEKKACNITLVKGGGKVSHLRTKEKDGYEAVQLEIAKTKNKSFLREFRIEESGMKVGDEVKIDIFEVGEKIHISGTTKGKGFQGVVKRYNFAGACKTHGHKHDLRKPGSIGSAYPQHVIKGRRMAGRMGGERATSENLKVVYIDKEKNLIGLNGAVPGIPGAIVEIYQK